MSSVTQRIKEIRQPRGGYINPKDFSVVHIDDGNILNPIENIHPTTIGCAVDYLTRFVLTNDLFSSFKVSILGAAMAGEMTIAQQLLSRITGTDDKSIMSVCQLVQYDQVARAGILFKMDFSRNIPNKETIENIRIMVNRSIKFFEKYGPITKEGFTFEGAYTDKIDSGDGDFLTKDTLWDFKVSKDNIKSGHTLQLLIYYIMGLYSIHDEFEEIDKIGIFNPRLNNVYTLNVDTIPRETINNVKKVVIGIDY